MRLLQLVEVSERVGATRKRLEKIGLLADLLRQLDVGDELAIAVGFLCGEPRQGKIGVGPALVRRSLATPAVEASTLTLVEADAALAHIAEKKGRGAPTERTARLDALMGRATRDEQQFLARLMIGEIRQGALEGIMVDAIARAAEVAAKSVRRALMLSGDRGLVARTALTVGDDGLAQFELEVGRAVQPMLAQTAESVDEALSKLGDAAFELKLDGARVQVHKSGDDVRVYTRNLNDVTAAVPELVESVRALPVATLILDGETIALRADGRPLPFQVTMKRFGRRLDVAEMRAELPLTTLFFDCLHADGESVIERAGRERFAILREVAGDGLVIPRLETGDVDEARAFTERAIAGGHEGVMAKDLAASYEAGARGVGWLKIKPAHTIDLVVLAAEWGSGRRQGWLSNLHLGARDPSGGFVMLGKTFKGLTDATLTWQTAELLARETQRDDYTVHVRPELVVEIAFNDVQSSNHYPGGFALRFARVKRYRPDKTVAEVDTIDTVRAIHARSLGE